MWSHNTVKWVLTGLYYLPLYHYNSFFKKTKCTNTKQVGILVSVAKCINVKCFGENLIKLK